MTSKEDILEDAVMVAIVITNNLIESMPKYDGIIVAYDRIKEVAIQFSTEHSLVKDWDVYCNEIGVSDWEEYVINYASDKLLN